jgi:YceI-like domain
MRTHRITLLAAVLLAACGAPGPRPSPASSTLPAAHVPVEAGAPSYAIDAARSQLTIRVYRAGPLARLGHNHVIVAHHLAGQASVAGGFSSLSLMLSIPVADLVVDDASARATGGPDFAEAVPDDARTGTRRNMESAAVLDAARFPTIAITAQGVEPPAAVGGRSQTQTLPLHLSVRLTVDVAGHRSTVQTPATLEAVDGGLVASGTAVLRQSELGLAPLSIMLGALQVQDEIGVDYRLVAAAPGPS